MMRRLPIYFLVDVSESMVGDPLNYVQEGIGSVIRELRKDPHALETVWVSVIVFAGRAKVVMPLTEIIQFYPVSLSIGSGTDLGVGLELLMTELDRTVVRTTKETKGDWKPIVFLFTDGRPTSDPSSAIESWRRNYSSRAFMICVSIGHNTDTEVLSGLSNENLVFNGEDEISFRKFFRWVTDSIITSSRSVAESSTQIVETSLQRGGVLDRADKISETSRSHVDERFAVFLAKCQTKSRPYLIKYEQSVRPALVDGLNLETTYYRLTGAYPVDGEKYAELSGASELPLSISTEELLGFPACPCCGNQFGFSTCGCGHLLCVGEEEVSTCPWCGVQARFTEGEGHVNVNRSIG